MYSRIYLFLATLLALGSTLSNAQETIDFSSQVSPILSDRCFHCHGPDADNQESSFRADSKDGLYEAVEPGDLDSSELYARIRSDDPDIQMPPPHSKRSLSAEEKRILELWIEQGAPYDGHWAFEIPLRHGIPQIDAVRAEDMLGWDEQLVADWSKNPIDSFVADRLIHEGLAPSPEADQTTLIRRASLTLTGLLPERGLQAEPEYEQAVEQMLDSMAYAERQTLRWLDAARYADTDGYQNDNPRENWPWRDWVIMAFRDNMPFDQFTIEQIAGDMLPNATEMQKLASAFNRNHRQNGEGGALADEFRVENVIDRVETTSTVFLGLTFGCARCHDHKYDPLSQREFFQMYGYFNNIGEKGIGPGLNANPTMKVFSPMADIDPKLMEALKSTEEELDKAKQEFDQRLNAWIEEMDALVERVGKAQSEEEKKSITDSDRTTFEELEKAALLKLLRVERKPEDAKKLKDHFAKIDPLKRKLEAKQREAMKAINQQGSYRATVMVMSERSEEPTPAYLLDRGQYDAPDKSENLPRGVPSSLLREKQNQPKDRLEFARWMISKDNPLTARVIVNRMWQDHFGVGLVKTSEDFGVQGETPSHPELLDWLAVEFMESGWDVKAMHRLIVTSATYRQSSMSTPELRSKDPENRLRARGPRYRADGFSIRDMALQAAGLLNKNAGGPAVKPYQPDGLWASMAASKGTRYKPGRGADLYRKSMYSFWKRAVNPPRQIIFDSGGREVCNVQVRRTNTPLQALVLMNDPTFVESARVLAQQVLQTESTDDSLSLGELYRRAVAKPINEAKLKVLQNSLTYFRKHYAAKPEDAKKLLAIGETTSDQNLDAVEHASLTAVAHVILNLDEFMTIE